MKPADEALAGEAATPNCPMPAVSCIGGCVRIFHSVFYISLQRSKMVRMSRRPSPIRRPGGAAERKRRREACRLHLPLPTLGDGEVHTLCGAFGHRVAVELEALNSSSAII